MKPYYDKDGITIYNGDCLEVLKHLEDESIHALISDPPYELGFMGKKWDSTGIANNVELWRDCLRVLKPGAHLLAFSGTRTYHRMAVAIEDAGFDVRDMLEWIYASGFPKSLNIGKAVDKLQGNEREVVREYETHDIRNAGLMDKKGSMTVSETKGNSEWEGFGTALKPAHEPICMARKPLEGKTIVENVLKHGTGGIDIDGCRIPTLDTMKEQKAKGSNGGEAYGNYNLDATYTPSEQGRFPANIICTDDALNDGVMTKSTASKGHHRKGNVVGDNRTSVAAGHFGDGACVEGSKISDSGSKSRYFDIDVWAEKHGLLQFPKASKKERGDGNIHATVKPIQIMAWLIRLVSRDSDLILDPFLGSGTTLVAAKKLGRKAIGIELSEEYCEIAVNRIENALEQKTLFRGGLIE